MLLSFTDNIEMKSVETSNWVKLRACKRGNIFSIRTELCSTGGCPITEDCQANEEVISTTIVRNADFDKCLGISKPTIFISKVNDDAGNDDTDNDASGDADDDTDADDYTDDGDDSLDVFLSILNRKNDDKEVFHKDQAVVIYRLRYNESRKNLSVENFSRLFEDILSQQDSMKLQMLNSNTSLIVSITPNPLLSKLHRLNFRNISEEQFQL